MSDSMKVKGIPALPNDAVGDVEWRHPETGDYYLRLDTCTWDRFASVYEKRLCVRRKSFNICTWLSSVEAGSIWEYEGARYVVIVDNNARYIQNVENFADYCFDSDSKGAGWVNMAYAPRRIS